MKTNQQLAFILVTQASNKKSIWMTLLTSATVNLSASQFHSITINLSKVKLKIKPNQDFCHKNKLKN